MLPVGVWLGLVALGWDGPAALVLLFAVEVPFRLWSALGIPVGHRTDFYGLPDPSVLGAALIALTDLTAWYVVASAIAATVRAGRSRRAAGDREAPPPGM